MLPSTPKWLEDVRKQLCNDLKRLQEGQTLMEVSQEAQRQIEELLKPKGALGQERAKEFSKHLTDLLLQDLSQRFGEPPEIFVQKVNESWFERFCAFFAKKLQEQPELNSFLQSQILAQVKDQLTELGEKFEQVLDAFKRWTELLPDIDRRLSEIEQLTKEVKRAIGIVRRDVEEILQLLRSQLGSEHLVITLRER
ncbi:MAG: hypothetical protein N3B10_15495, partial [Armatimonadetes bacterium]|nr:hypothetical protein [Armatimonadota bacterium]